MIRSRYTAAITDRPWWLAGGIDPSACVAAYRAVGVASLAASYTNLANPSIYTLSPFTPPTFDPSVGWSFDGTMSMTTGILHNQRYSIAVKYSNATYDAAIDRYIVAAYNPGTGHVHGIQERRNGELRFINSNGFASVAGVRTSGVAIISTYNAGVYNGYYNGEFYLTSLIGTSAVQQNYYIGSRANSTSFYIGNVQAIAFYDAAFTASTVASLTAAMNAL